MRSNKLYTVKAFLVILIILVFSGCKKYLDKKSDNSLIVPTTIIDLQMLLDNGEVMNNNTPAYVEASSDDYFVRDETYNSIPNENFPYIWEQRIVNFSSDWAKPYTAVYNANLCLERLAEIPKTTFNENQWNNIYGSSLFYRSYHFLNLLWTYSKAYDKSTADSDLGIALRSASDFNVPSVRSSVSEGYKQVIKDLATATEYLPNVPTVPLRPSKAASYGLLARAYFSMREYDSSYKYSNLSLGIMGELLDYNSSSVNATSNTPFQAYPFNKEVIFYSLMTNSFSLKAPSVALVDTALHSSYATDDKRKTVFFRLNGNYQRFKGSYSSNILSLFTGLAVDEILLMRAESQARLGFYVEGMADLNALLVKRWATGKFTPLVAANKEQALEFILRERRKELLMRGLRWMDLKRLNKDGANIIPKRLIAGQTYTLPPNDNRYALPLPDDIVRLTGMPQNPR